LTAARQTPGRGEEAYIKYVTEPMPRITPRTAVPSAFYVIQALGMYRL
jgi:hypothetical protein